METVTADETGRIDVEVDPSATTTDPTHVEEITSTEAEASAETENTEEPATEHMIPKSRLDQVIGQKQEAKEQLEAAMARIAELERGATKPEVEAAPEPVSEMPRGLDEAQQAAWYVRSEAKKLIQEELGMDLRKARTILDAAAGVAQESTDAKWTRMCQENKLDPKSEPVQEMMSGLIQVLTAKGKMSNADAVTEAFARTAKAYGVASSPTSIDPATPVASVESASVSGTMAKGRLIPRDRKHAQEMAAAGQRATYQSTQEIISEAIDKLKSDGPTTRLVQ